MTLEICILLFTHLFIIMFTDKQEKKRKWTILSFQWFIFCSSKLETLEVFQFIRPFEHLQNKKGYVTLFFNVITVTTTKKAIFIVRPLIAVLYRVLIRCYINTVLDLYHFEIFRILDYGKNLSHISVCVKVSNYEIHEFAKMIKGKKNKYSFFAKSLYMGCLAHKVMRRESFSGNTNLSNLYRFNVAFCLNSVSYWRPVIRIAGT